MATIKSYTDIEQSRKLAEFLSLESADMAYWKRSYRPNDYAITAHHSKELQEGFEAKCIEYIPCWSLAALLESLKYPSLTQDVENKWFITDWTGAYPKSEYGLDNAIDACVEMILKLHELKML